MRPSVLKLAAVLLVSSSWLHAETYSFTNAGASGNLGPTQGDVDTAYSSGNTLNGQVTVNTQGIQEWTVPTTGTYRITAAGAEGGSVDGYPSIPGKGAIIQGDFNLTQGTVLKVVVAQRGGDETNPGNGGGGGGGASWVYTSAIGGSGLLIAAGGGAGVPEDNVGDGPDASVTTAATNNCGSGIGYGGGTDIGGGGGAGWLSDGATGDNGSGIGYGGERFDGGASGGGGADNYGGFGGGGGANDNESGGGAGYTGGCGSGNNGANVGAGGSFNAGANQAALGLQSGNGYVTITLIHTASVPFSPLGLLALASLFGFFGFRKLKS